MYVVEIVAPDANVLEDIKFFENGADALAFILRLMIESEHDTEVCEDDGSFFFTHRADARVICAVLYKAKVERFTGAASLQSRLAGEMLESENPSLAINTFLYHVRTQVGHA